MATDRGDYRNVLGIETSCDETGVALLEEGRRIRANVVVSQADLHDEYGGVVPEIACRAHVRSLLPVMDRALEEAECSLEDIDMIGVTREPGLIGSLLVGLQGAKGLSVSFSKPIWGVDHISAHLYSCTLHALRESSRHLSDIAYPRAGLVVSGGHTGLYRIEGPGRYERLGSTMDDAAGEAFDKVASMLDLGYPGGPEIERKARHGDPDSVDFPRPMINSGDYQFSFSGLKTAVLYHCRGQNESGRDTDVSDAERVDIAASFQEAVVDVLVRKLERAAEDMDAMGLSVGGGVAANGRFRERLHEMAEHLDVSLHVPPLSLCTDNAAMIAGKAYFEARHREPDSLHLEAIPT